MGSMTRTIRNFIFWVGVCVFSSVLCQSIIYAQINTPPKPLLVPPPPVLISGDERLNLIEDKLDLVVESVGIIQNRLLRMEAKLFNKPAKTTPKVSVK